MKLYMLMITIMVMIYSLPPTIVNADTNDKINKIEQFVEEQRAISKIPGIAVLVVEEGETVFQKGFGYADVKTKTPVTSDTLFEIGSTTKAFTGLAILQLEKDGLLDRSDDIQQYIPWLKLKYKSELQPITIHQLLHHTSGIASNSIIHIPESNQNNAIEQTVKTLLEQPLNRKPGSSFEYATINYDVLGLIIEKVTKQPFDTYIKQRILEPINMNDSLVGLPQIKSAEMATGYKIGWMREQTYTPPIYRGNVPAGYIISNTNDIAKWLKLQLGISQIYSIDKKIIQESHIHDQSVEPFDKDTYYASGWAVMDKDEKQYLFHAGENPTFTSYFIMQPDEKFGVAVLSNMNSSFTTAIGKGVMGLWEGKNVTTNHSDSYQKLDKVVTILCIVVASLGVILGLLLMRNVLKIKKKQRIGVSLSGKRIFLLIIHSMSVAAIVTLMIMFPKAKGLTWEFIKVWAPTSISALFYFVIVTGIIYYLYGLLLLFTKRNKF
ncbi:beta-lactamase family protein [Lysinibacillus fusiformis]|nr:beta-lactamase family protein [Lysinibacillus fusiformis]